MAVSTDRMKIRSAEDNYADAKKLIGVPVHDPGDAPLNYQVEFTDIDFNRAVMFSGAIGDDNPLYTDPVYARTTRWGTVIAQPTILTAVRYGICRGADAWARYPIAGLVAGFWLEFNDVIRMDDSFESSFYLKDIAQKKGRTGTLNLRSSEVMYWNQYKQLVATGGANHIAVVREKVTEEDLAKAEGMRKDMIYERGTYKYSQEEIKEIVDIVTHEERRGASTRYWESVKVGDKLVPVVKGPLTTYDMMAAWAACRGVIKGHHGLGAFELYLQRMIDEPGSRVNPVTNWPYEAVEMEHYDWNLCRGRGLPAPFDRGVLRYQVCSHLLSNWMGDDGFIRRLEAQNRKPNFYGDTTFFNAEVIKVYKDKVGDVEYGAVDIRITGTNQIGESSQPGTATVYLPSRELGAVKIPIPHGEEKYELYRRYLRDCDYVSKNPIDVTMDVDEWHEGFKRNRTF